MSQRQSSLSLSGNIILTNTGLNTFTFAGATRTEISYVHRVTSAVQTQLNNTINKSGSTMLTGNVSLSGPYTFSGASPFELSYLSGTTIQTQLNNKQVSGTLQ